VANSLYPDPKHITSAIQRHLKSEYGADGTCYLYEVYNEPDPAIRIQWGLVSAKFEMPRDYSTAEKIVQDFVEMVINAVPEIKLYLSHLKIEPNPRFLLNGVKNASNF
jgi:hypothetical protein